ncbi:MAG: hypothetical protein J5691_01165 [Bacilli bacterium]|nr:hypothetical protein [Bacilli bacterium]
MTKAEAIAKIKESMKENVLNVTDAEQTVANIDAKPVEDVKAAEGMPNSELPTQSDVEKVVNSAEETLVPADEDGVSKNGGEKDIIDNEKIEAERKKEDNAMKDVINVADRKVEENAEVQAELLKQLEEASAREAEYKAKVAEINTLCEEALKVQREELIKSHSQEMEAFFEAIIAKGEAFEKELTESAEKNEKAYKSAKKLYESSLKMNKMLLEAVKKAQPVRNMTRYVTPARRALESVSK